MGHDNERIIRYAVGHGHGFSGTYKRFCGHHHGGYAQFFHDDAVEQTARTAGASVTNPGQHKITFLGQHLGGIIFDCVGYGMFFYGDYLFEKVAFG